MTKPTNYASIPRGGSSTPAQNAIQQNLEVLTGRAGDGMHRALTPDDLKDLPGISVRRLRGATGASQIVIEPVETTYDIPPRPTNVAADGAFSHIFIGWDRPRFSSFSYAEIFRSTVDDFGTAVSLATTTRSLYADPVDYGAEFYYWVRFVNLGNVAGPIHATNGEFAQSAPNILAVMQELSEEINEGYLAQTLRARIDLIDLPDTGLIDRLNTEVNTRISEVTTLTNDLVAEANQRIADILTVNNRIDSSDLNILANEQDITQLQIDVSNIDGEGSANASAISALDVRVTENEGDISSQATQITNLNASLTTSNSNISGNAGAISAIDARVTQNEDDITSQASQISSLNSSLSAANGNITGNSSAIGLLDTRVTASEDEITSHASQLVSINSAISSANSNISGNAGAIGAIDTRVTQNEDDITAQSSDISSLNSSLSTTNSNVSVNASGLSALTTRVTSNENELVSVGSQITQIENDIAAIESGGSGNSSAISALDSRVTINEGDISTQSSQITTLQNDVASALSNASGNASAISALDSRVGSTESSITSQSSQITTLNNSVTTAQVTADSRNAIFYGPSSSVPTATGVDDVWYVSNLGNLPRRWNGSAWVDIQDTAIAGNSSAISTLDSRVDTAEGNITSQGSAVTALQNSVTDLETDTGANATAISAIDTRVTSTESDITSQATSILQLQSDVGDNTSTIQQLVSVTDGLDAMWAVSASVGTLRAGFGLRIDQSGSEFIVDADRFTIRNGASDINPFIVDGNDTYISSAFMEEGWINNAHVGNLTTDAITGLNASFIQANIGTLYVDNIEGDVNKIYSSSSSVPVGFSAGFFRGVLEVSVPLQTRPRFPISFTQLKLEAPVSLTSTKLRTMMLRENASATSSDFTCVMHAATTGGKQTSITLSSVPTLTMSGTLNSGESVPSLPTNWGNLSTCAIATLTLGGRTLVFKPTGTTFSGSNSAGPSQFYYYRTMPLDWVFQVNGSAVTTASTFANGATIHCWNDMADAPYTVMHGGLTLWATIAADEPQLVSSTFVDGAAVTSISEYIIGVAGDSRITCNEVQVYTLMVR